MQEIEKTELDDENEKVLEKFHFLIEKYHHSDNSVVKPQPILENDDIPILTESVKLRSTQELQSDFGELSPLRLLLDAALQDANIDLNTKDRRALVQALENRIIVQEKDNSI